MIKMRVTYKVTYNLPEPIFELRVSSDRPSEETIWTYSGRSPEFIGDPTEVLRGVCQELCSKWS